MYDLDYRSQESKLLAYRNSLKAELMTPLYKICTTIESYPRSSKKKLFIIERRNDDHFTLLRIGITLGKLSI